MRYTKNAGASGPVMISEREGDGHFCRFKMICFAPAKDLPGSRCLYGCVLTALVSQISCASRFRVGV